MAKLLGKTFIDRALRNMSCAHANTARRASGRMVVLSGFALLGILLEMGQIFAPPVRASSKAEGTEATEVSNPDAVCAQCHREIYNEYERTAMARGSGNAVDGMLSGGFLHDPSGIRYRLFLRDGKAWMSFDRDADPGDAGGRGPLHGERELIYYIGSNHRGRTYLYQEDGEWFELPINYYAKKNMWDMAPNFGGSETMPTALPVDSNCLHCHATAVQASMPQARNRYNGPPFLQGGVGCSACHGDPSEHLARHGAGAILNPAHLEPAKRDSICLQCHLEGDVTVFRAGKSLVEFRPGDDISNYVIHFVKASASTGGRRAVSQYEALLQSACKRASGDRLTCTTCHDPHFDPAPQDRVSYYRSKCLACHTGVDMAERHHPEQQNCAVCHMPDRKTSDISHEQVTDHNIQARPSVGSGSVETDNVADLKPVGNVTVGDREYGLAYAQLAQHGARKAGEKALALLQRAEKQGADDFELHTQLGFLNQMAGNGAGALKEYEDAARENPYDTTALGDLAVLYAASGHVEEATRLLQQVMDDDPSNMAAGLDLAYIECRVGDRKRALDILTGLSRINPDDPAIRIFLSAGTYEGKRCELR